MKNSIESKPWGTFEGKQVTLWRLVNANGLELHFTDWGARLIKAIVSDRRGTFDNVTLGWPTLDEYVAENGGTYYGAIVGRYANRIGKGKFSIDGVEYNLELNNAPADIPCALHGGSRGFSLRSWECTEEIHTDDEVGLVFKITSPDGEGGYPGNVTAYVKFTLDNKNVWRIEYSATTDKATHLAFTEHAYWNLNGINTGNGVDDDKTILHHRLMVNADYYTAYGPDMIPTGELCDVSYSPMDLRSHRMICTVNNCAYEQLVFGHGFDTNWVLRKDGNEKELYSPNRKIEDGAPKANNELTLACELISGCSGRKLEVWTTEPGVQIYDGYFLPVRNAGVAIETQHFPDSPNKPNFPSTLLKPGEELHSVTEYRFSTIG